MDARNVEKPETFSVEAPDGAPNIVVVLIDDIGFWCNEHIWRLYQHPYFRQISR